MIGTNNESTAASRRGLDRNTFLFLVVLSLGGVAIMEYSVKYGLWYWLAIVLLDIVIRARRARAG